MNISTFVQRVQQTLVVAGITNIFLAAVSAMLVASALSALVDASNTASVFFTIVAITATVGYCLWRLNGIRSLGRIALWIEERVPALQYAVVTSVENGSTSPEVDGSVRLDAIRPVIRHRITRLFLRSALLLTVSLAIYLLSPATSLGRGRIQSGLSRALPGVIPPVDKLAHLRVRVVPPVYSRFDAVERVNPASVSILAGSQVLLSGSGSPEGVTVSVDDRPIMVKGNADSWSAKVVATKPVSVLRTTFKFTSRQIVVEAIPDNAPHVTLTAPIHDTTLRTPNFSVLLRASTSDDIGLAAGYFEYLIVSGSGEAFSGQTTTSPPVHFDSRTGSMRVRLDFGAHKISAGDLVSVRAVVRDNNTFTGPSIGTSDPRTFRVARTDEYDSVSIEAAAPPPVDSSAMSQRMLIILTESLVKKQKLLARQELVKQSDDIGFMEDRIRKRVYDNLYQTDSPEGVGDTEEVESEIRAINNPDLKQAYDALWDAVRSLRIAEPAVALPPMRIALKALDRARLAKRIYLRGAAPRVVVDIARVRLTGKEKGSSSTSAPQFTSDSSRKFLIEGLRLAMEKSKTDSRQAIEDLSLLRARSLASSPGFAAELKEAIDLLQANRPADAPMMRARKTLTPLPRNPATTDWGGG